MAASAGGFYNDRITSSKNNSYSDATGSVSARAVSHASKQENKLPKDESRGKNELKLVAIVMKN